MNRSEVHTTAYSARIEAVEALRAQDLQSGPDAARLRRAADDLRASAKLFGRAPGAASYGALADLFEIVALLSEWRLAVLNASVDAQRFLTAAKERSTAWLAGSDAGQVAEPMREVAQAVVAMQAIGEVAEISDRLSRIPVPIGTYSSPQRTLRVPEFSDQTTAESCERTRPAELAVAFVRFTINGVPLDEVHYVTPGETHDMDVEVRVSRWPKGATHLMLEPVSVEHPDTYRIQSFLIEAPAGEAGPFRLKGKGRMLLKVPNSIQARPYQFKYTARFVPAGSEQPVEIIGDREVRLEGADVARQPLTGYHHIDLKLMEVRNRLRTLPHLDHKELSDALIIAIALGNHAGQTVQANLFKESIDEREFQKRMAILLRQRPEIASELEEHPHAAGGITDLSYRGIPLELKAEQENRLAPDDCRQFVDQAASYAIGNGKHIALLCVLDGSPKKEPAFPAEDGIFVMTVQQPSGTPVYVITVLLQGNLARPSSFS